MTPRADRRQPGFSLVELLVVLAVLGLLIAIMAPVFARVVPVAYRMRCVANLRNIISSYSVRQGEQHLMPMTAAAWTRELLPYLGNNRQALLCQADDIPHQSLPDIKLDITYLPGAGDSHVPHVLNIFTTYPYWLEGGCPDPGPGIWKLNDVQYAEFIAHGPTYAPSILYRYERGEDPNSYWFVVEEGQSGDYAGSDQDYDDFRMRVTEIPEENRLEITCEKQWYYTNYAFILPDGSKIGEDQTLGYDPNKGPFSFSLGKRASYGMNWQGPMIGPAESKIIFLDYEKEECYIGGDSSIVDVWDEDVAPRHMGRVNIALSDGSVRDIDPDEINPENYGGEVRDAKWWSPGE